MKLVELPVTKINISVFQPRGSFEKEELTELAESIKDNGLLNPIHVRKNGDDTYQIIAGERRWRAAQLAGLDTIYAFVKEVTLEEQRIESLIENVHRKDLNMIEKGGGMLEIFKVHGVDMKPSVIAGKIGNIRQKKESLPLDGSSKKIHEVLLKIHVKPRTVQQWLESISADEEVIKDHLKTPEKERISDSTIARVSSIKEPEFQKKVYTKIKKQDMGKKQASAFITQLKKLDHEKQEKILSSSSPVEVVGDKESGYAINVYSKNQELEEQYLSPIIVPTPKHIDDIPNSQLYIERSVWNVNKFLDQIDFFTIGTDDKKLSQIIGLINQINAEERDKLIVVDTRDTPYSRFKPELNKSNISEEFSKIGISYIHIQELGIPKKQREQLFSGEISEDELWSYYENNILTNALKKKILKILDNQDIPIFLCTEISPTRCHRHIIANWLEKEKNLTSFDL